MVGFIRRIAAAALPLATLAAAGVLLAPMAAAQSGQEQASAEAIPSMPVDVLAATLAQKNNGRAIDRYLRGDGASPGEVARRAANLIRKLGVNRAALEPATLLNAVDRVTHVAARSLSFVPVIQLAVAHDFRPENAVLAWDFGPPGSTVMAGFEHLSPTDRRLAGIGVASLRRNDENALQTDGIAGVRRIELPLTDGDYRIILMTQNFGVASLTAAPFGREVRVNGIPLLVRNHGPSRWAPIALASRGGVRAASGKYRSIGGYLTGNVGGEADALYARQEGGALIIEGSASGGSLIIELHGFAKAQSYLTGLVVEQLGRTSDLMLSESAFQSVVPQAVRVALETEIMLAAAEVVQGIAPAAGLVLEGEDVVTAN